MNITLWSDFSKKKNSTKQPSTEGITKTVNLKENTSLESPVFIISEPVTPYVYAQWGSYYYFVTDVVNLDANRSEIVCRMDALASNKINIGNYTAFVERAASAYDALINDSMLSNQQYLASVDHASAEITGLDSSGCYIFRTMSTAGLKTYATTSMQVLGGLFTNILTSSGKTLNDIWNAILSVGLQALDISQYVNSLMWMPLDASTLGTPSGIDIQWWNFTATNTYSVASPPTKRFSGTLPVPTNIYGDFRKRSSEFSRYTYRLPGVGVVEINPTDAAEDDLWYNAFIDVSTGAVNYEIYHEDGEIVAAFAGQIGVDVPYGSNHFNSAGVFQTMLGTAVSASTGNATSMAADAVLSGVNVSKALLTPQTSFNGGSGNRAYLIYTSIIATCENYGSKEFPTAVAGRPLCQNVQLSTLSGYIKCGGASIDIVGIGPEKDEINMYLNSGFYYE